MSFDLSEVVEVINYCEMNPKILDVTDIDYVDDIIIAAEILQNDMEIKIQRNNKVNSLLNEMDKTGERKPQQKRLQSKHLNESCYVGVVANFYFTVTATSKEI